MDARAASWQRTSFLFLLLFFWGGRAASEDDIGLLESIRFMLGGSGPAPKKVDPQPLKVIGAGFGRTGTSSLVVAFRRLGLKSYHMKEGVMETPGHQALWCEHARRDLETPGELTGEETETEKDLFELLARDGFNATTDIPANFLYAKGIARYPQAKVVLSVRSSGEVWAQSILGTTGRNCELLKRPPFAWLPPMREFLILNEWMWGKMGAPCDPVTGIIKAADLAAAHDKWIKSVQQNVPAGRLLIFQASDGWRPLCEFLSPVDPEVTRRCNEILQSEEPYPWVNDTPNMKRLYAVFFFMTTPWPWLALLLLTCVTVRYCCCRGGADKRSKCD